MRCNCNFTYFVWTELPPFMVFQLALLFYFHTTRSLFGNYLKCNFNVLENKVLEWYLEIETML